ncbi:MAG: hypothetical protein J4F98_15530 [Acidobacteria bacterium]|nr:hypothetical protein [Acidobacteriota bacterium]
MPTVAVRSDIGAISPGRWQPTQWRIRMGATSLLKTTGSAAVVTAGAKNARARPSTAVLALALRKRVISQSVQD